MDRNSSLMMGQVLFSIGKLDFWGYIQTIYSTEKVLFKFKINSMFIFDTQLMNKNDAFICICIQI